MDDGGDPTRGAVMRELLLLHHTYFLDSVWRDVDTKARYGYPVWSFRRIVNTPSLPPSSFPPNMCPLRPCSLPTTTGVFVRDTAEWLAYSPAVTAKILESYGLSVSDLTATGDAVKEDRPGSPRSVLGGAPSASVSPDRGTLDLGSFGLGGGAYTLDTGTGLQVSPRGFSRPILFVFADTASRDRFARTLSACDMKCETAVAQGVTTRSTGKVITRILLAPVHVVSRVLPIRLLCTRIGGGGKAASEETNSADSAEQEAERVALHFQLAVKRWKEEEEAAKEAETARRQKVKEKKAKKAKEKKEKEKKEKAAAKRRREEAVAKRKREREDMRKKAKLEKEEEEAAKVIRDVEKILKTNRKAIDAVTKAYHRAELVNEPKLDPKLPHVERFVKKVASKSSEILLGYHGTSAANATAIMAGGFCPMKRMSSRGAYFSGNHMTSYEYAAGKSSFIGGGSILLVALAREYYLGNANSTLSCSPDNLNRRVDGDLMEHNIVVFEEYACLPIAHIRGVC
jgi:hypothetical protein